MTPLLAFVIGAVVGAIIGSFLANLIIRWPQGRSVVGGRSMCDHCGTALGPLDLIPLLSFAIRRGRCAHCRGGIHPLHIWVELGCAMIGGVALMLAPGWEGVGWAALGWGLLTLAVLDWRHFWLPDAITLPLVFLGMTLGVWTTDVTLMDRVIGAVTGYGALLTIALGYRAWRGREGLGLGDAKLLAAIGAWFGWQALPFVLLIASVVALLVVLFSTARGEQLSATTQVPLGTFLCIAAVPGFMLMRVLTQG
ncbi:prepilin peptidase [Sphingobium sp. SCG-1]|uniref:prepilin peptidase n=1 Tax=Sphingobium sp. SCG-1 TaxID=2072936 RepID=UPI000CD676E3|nr:A24 family peptidase [Sphingobium sp. SCG-1]AUW58692.1 prepilin peptidase [Sphingobium sp. SCG-1]